MVPNSEAHGSEEDASLLAQLGVHIVTHKPAHIHLRNFGGEWGVYLTIMSCGTVLSVSGSAPTPQKRPVGFAISDRPPM